MIRIVKNLIVCILKSLRKGIENQIILLWLIHAYIAYDTISTSGFSADDALCSWEVCPWSIRPSWMHHLMGSDETVEEIEFEANLGRRGVYTWIQTDWAVGWSHRLKIYWYIRTRYTLIAPLTMSTRYRHPYCLGHHHVPRKSFTEATIATIWTPNSCHNLVSACSVGPSCKKILAEPSNLVDHSTPSKTLINRLSISENTQSNGGDNVTFAGPPWTYPIV